MFSIPYAFGKLNKKLSKLFNWLFPQDHILPLPPIGRADGALIVSTMELKTPKPKPKPVRVFVTTETGKGSHQTVIKFDDERQADLFLAWLKSETEIYHFEYRAKKIDV